MPGKKPPAKKHPAAAEPAWQILLEEISSQNRATIEAVQGSRDELKREIAELRENTDTRFQVLEAAIRQNSADIRQNSADIRQNSADIRQNSADIRELRGEVRQNTVDIHTLQRDVRNLADKVDDLSNLEPRVSALELQRG